MNHADEIPNNLVVFTGDCFWLRICDDGKNITDMPDLGVTLPGAVKKAVAMGRTPTHWYSEGTIMEIPFSVLPKTEK